MEIIKASLMAALHSSGGGANLDSVTFTENDTYTPVAPLDGWDEVTVNVPTYEDEYRRMKECCDEVVKKIQEYDDEWVPVDPTEEIPEEIDKIAGYEPPNDPPREDVIDALVPLGGGDVDTVVTGTAAGYTYKLEFAGWAQDIYSMREPVTGEAINTVVTSSVFNSFVEGRFELYGYLCPVCKITIEGLSGRNWGYVGGGVSFPNGSAYWAPICDAEWKFGIEDISVTNDPQGRGCWINAVYYPSDAGWVSTDIFFAGVITKDSVTTKIYTQQ